MRILLINAEQDEHLFATFKHEHILYDQQPESDTLDISENIYDVIVYNPLSWMRRPSMRCALCAKAVI